MALKSWRRGVLLSGSVGRKPVCPMCGTQVSWSCPSRPGSTGVVRCQNGGYVSFRVNKAVPVCQWVGASCVREISGDVVTGTQLGVGSR